MNQCPNVNHITERHPPIVEKDPLQSVVVDIALVPERTRIVHLTKILRNLVVQADASQEEDVSTDVAKESKHDTNFLLHIQKL